MCENEIKETVENVEIESINAEPEPQEPESDGKIVYANDVIATIAAIAAQEVEGIAGMGGSSDWFEVFGKKSITKGIKVELGSEEVCVDVYVNVRYGFKIRGVCENLQQAIKTAIETMTGLNVVEVNVYVQSVVFDKPEEPKAEEAKPAEIKSAEPVPEIKESPITFVTEDAEEAETEEVAEAPAEENE